MFDEPTASDDSGELTVNLVSELGSGDLFPVGTTTVTYEATGENGETITCSFVVEIIDENLPEIVLCPENIEVEIASGRECYSCNLFNIQNLPIMWNCRYPAYWAGIR